MTPSSSVPREAVAHLYSGGADSSLAACRLAQSFPKVYLNTFGRFGFLNLDFAQAHMERARQRFPSVTFVHQTIGMDAFYEEIESHGFYRSLARHGWLVLNTCGHCKVAMHWRNLVFCLDHGVRYASDGAVRGAEEFAEQNPRILMGLLEDFYRRFGVTLLRPSYEEGLSTERELFALGVATREKIKGTAHDMQVTCTQHVQFAMMLRIYLRGRSFDRYEAAAKTYLAEKLDHASRLTEEHLARPGGGRVARMLERDRCG